jgi:ribosomal protein S1
MVEQEISIQIGDNPFDTKKVKIHVPKGTKILSTASNVLELLSIYGLNNSDGDTSMRSESKEEFITQGEVIFISKDSTGKKINALIDIGAKHTATCSLLKESPQVVENIEVGTVIDVKIKTSDRGLITASISDAIEDVKLNEIMKSIGDKGVAFNGTVVELINGGYWVELGGIKCFMPGSLAGLNKLWDFDSLVGKNLIVMPLSYSKEKETIIVSHREYLNTLIPNAIDDLSSNMKTHITGFVTGTTKFGVFAEFNECLTGIIPASELDEETLSKLEKNQIKPGDSISFWPKDIISNKKIILTQKGPAENPWDNAREIYKPMMTVQGTVTKITKYGAFVELEKGVSGLIHKTRFTDVNLSKGDVINVKIQSINSDDKKIVMTLAD